MNHIKMLKLPSHGAYHRVLAGLACHVSHGMPKWAERRRDRYVADAAMVLFQNRQKKLGQQECANIVYLHGVYDILQRLLITSHSHVARYTGIVYQQR